ncbi:unnamed protein product [Didymodactylos carnosus]|uniref:WWE domain-containing protein n=1 Tax=Didymodactylos carnosus TaxID=1234261 RepID=A0A814I138_9BILA|nr:unnamed protein product [Didymodactylos carnosus]CAF3788291.1 unnamed protein product [Didymodactylos carnosus]
MANQVVNQIDQKRAQWYWKSNSDPWSVNKKEEWTKYSDIESEIIEEASNEKTKTKLVELDNYWINLNDYIQINKYDKSKQRQIKRVLINRNENQGLREERFFHPQVLNKPFNDDYGASALGFLADTAGYAPGYTSYRRYYADDASVKSS